MSFLKHFFPEDFAKPPRAAASPRVRSLKGFTPEQVAALQDALLTDDPTMWILSAGVAAAVGFTGHVGILTPPDPALVVVVDGAIVGCNSVAERIRFDVVEGGQAVLALASDTNVFKRNRREQATTTAVEKVGLSRIIDNTNALNGQEIARVGVSAGPGLFVPLGYRLYQSEQFFAVNSTANVPLECTMWGRIEAKRR